MTLIEIKNVCVFNGTVLRVFLHAVIESFEIIFCLSCRLKLTKVFIGDRDICITVITVYVTFVEIRN